MAITPTTWNPADKGIACTLSNGNLTTSSQKTNGSVRSGVGVSTGKWYWEVAYTGGRPFITGVGTASATLGDWPGSDANGWAYYYLLASKINSGAQTAYGTSWGGGAIVVGVALDMDAGTLAFFKNGVSLGIAFTGIVGTVYAMIGGDDNSEGANATANFGATAFAYTPPAGFEAGFGTPIAQPNLSGVVRDSSGAFAARPVRAIREDTGAYVGGVISNATTGAYTISTPYSGEHTIVAYPVSGEDLPALVLNGVIPL